jgi:hypothetical protein
VGEWLQTVQHDQDEVAGARSRDDLHRVAVASSSLPCCARGGSSSPACLLPGPHLPAATLAVLGALDDAREVQHLNFGA